LARGRWVTGPSEADCRERPLLAFSLGDHCQLSDCSFKRQAYSS